MRVTISAGAHVGQIIFCDKEAVLSCRRGGSSHSQIIASPCSCHMHLNCSVDDANLAIASLADRASILTASHRLELSAAWSGENEPLGR